MLLSIHLHKHFTRTNFCPGVNDFLWQVKPGLNTCEFFSYLLLKICITVILLLLISGLEDTWGQVHPSRPTSCFEQKIGDIYRPDQVDLESLNTEYDAVILYNPNSPNSFSIGALSKNYLPRVLVVCDSTHPGVPSGTMEKPYNYTDPIFFRHDTPFKFRPKYPLPGQLLTCKAQTNWRLDKVDTSAVTHDNSYLGSLATLVITSQPYHMFTRPFRQKLPHCRPNLLTMAVPLHRGVYIYVIITNTITIVTAVYTSGIRGRGQLIFPNCLPADDRSHATRWKKKQK